MIPMADPLQLFNIGQQVPKKYQDEINKSKEFSKLVFADYDLDVLKHTLGTCF